MVIAIVVVVFVEKKTKLKEFVSKVLISAFMPKSQGQKSLFTSA